MADLTNLAVWAPSFGDGGGIQAFSSETARALARWKPQLVSRSKFGGRSRSRLHSMLGSCRFALHAYRSALVHRSPCIFSTHLNFGPAARILSQWTGKPYFLVAHGIDVSADLSASRRRALQSCHQIIAVSQHTCGRLHALPELADKPLRILPNTVDDQRFRPGSPNSVLLEKLAIPRDKRIVLTVGRLSAAEKYKGYDAILNAWTTIRDAVPDAHYVLCGKGDDEPRIRQLIQQLQLKDCVTLTGFVSDEDLPDIYRSASVFAMPSTGEGFGIVYLEAMASGVPVLAGNRDGSVDALANGELGILVDPTSHDEVGRGIVSLLKRQGSEWWYKPEVLREQVLQRFGRQQFAKTLNEIVDDTMSRVQSVRPKT